MKIDKAIDAMRHLLMTYAQDMEYIPKQINTYVNTSEHFDIEKLINFIDNKVAEYALLEHKSIVLKGFLTQVVTQMNANASVTSQPVPQEND